MQHEKEFDTKINNQKHEKQYALIGAHCGFWDNCGMHVSSHVGLLLQF
jgi:hypothetical protein